MILLVADVPYQLSVHTGDVSGAGTDANVFVVLYGERGKSDTCWLRNKTDNFERNEVDVFKVCWSLVRPYMYMTGFEMNG